MKLKEQDCDALIHAADACTGAARKFLDIVMLRHTEEHLKLRARVCIEEARGSLDFAAKLISDFEKRKLK